MSSTQVCLIVVGAAASNIDLGNDPYKWNNPKQADIHEVLKFGSMLKAEGMTVQIQFWDPMYPGSEETDYLLNHMRDSEFGEFHIYRESFDLRNAKGIISGDCVNIVLEFYNPLDENWVMQGVKAAPTYLSKYKDDHLAFLACGCMWDKGFPADCIWQCIWQYMTINLTTPLETNNWMMFEQLLSMDACFARPASDKSEVLMPFLKGCMMVMGTLMCRGMGEDYSTEEVVLEFVRFGSISAYMKTEAMSEELASFANGTRRWNTLSYALRKHVSELVYGEHAVSVCV